ncbi:MULTISPECIES: LPS assembly lipoprotein LptE [Rheinheimera]|uniref:LPS-assembly lipoprotein LptE n=1 Tax=Rheinheimera TaxID=67575 RepID=UPI001E501AB7|nr:MULTISPECIES: LPS assembly lipoprotein LptE [Rheinheimera]MDF3126833.1 LPS assembly lipoprotein LptE [Rheinheimera sp. 1928-s]
MKKHSVWTGLLLISSLLLTSCGFHLRGSLPLERYPAIFVDAKKHSELASLLSDQLESNKVKLLTELDPKAPALMLQQDSLERRTLSLFPNGQVAEYELIYRVKYQLLLPDQELQEFQFELTRDYQDDPNLALAKAKELDLLLQELRSQAASRIIRQLNRLN